MPLAPLRVLWLTKGLGPGGAERLLVTHAAVADPDRVTYEAAYLLPHKTHLVAELEALGVRHPRPGRRPATSTPAGCAGCGRLIDEGYFDVVHAHSPRRRPRPACSCGRCPRSRRPAFVYTEHNRWPSHSRATRPPTPPPSGSTTR